MDESLRLQKKMAHTYAGIIDRCHNPDCTSYYWYGARGIEMCERWQCSLDAFIKDMGPPPTAQHSIDRINHNGNYEPSNCRWATQEEQNNNTRRSKLIDWNGRTQSIRDWAKEYNIGSRALSERLRRGWDMEKSLTTPGRMNFEDELKERKERGRESWKAKGKIYQARSKKRRGQKLSIVEQKAFDEGQLEEMIKAQQHTQKTIEIQKEYEKLAIDIEKNNVLRAEILNFYEAGVASRRIARHMQVPQKVVNLVIKNYDRLYQLRAQPAS
jgi:hypothetical protein